MEVKHKFTIEKILINFGGLGGFSRDLFLSGRFFLNNGSDQIAGNVSIVTVPATEPEAILQRGDSEHPPRLEISDLPGSIDRILMCAFKKDDVTISFETQQNLVNIGAGGSRMTIDVWVIEFRRTLV